MLLVGGCVVVLVAFGFGAFYARRALVPIRESLVQQRAALRRQREFAADASHELRTPLTVIRSSVEHLRRNRTETAATATEALDDIDAEVGHLTALVEDLLLLARSDSGAIALTRLPVDLGDVAADGAGALVKAAADRDVHLGLDPEPAIVDGDHARLRQLTVILVDNAIRHTPRGGNVRVRVRGDRRRGDLEVDDDGPGIRPEDMPHVFERFWRAPGRGGRRDGPRPRDRQVDRRPPRRADRRRRTGPRAARGSPSGCRPRAARPIARDAGRLAVLGDRSSGS